MRHDHAPDPKAEGATAGDTKSTASVRHPACPGCCACLGTVLPIVAPEPEKPWLEADPDELFTAEDYLVAQVLLPGRMSVDDRVDELRAFYRVHGARRLLAALDRAAELTYLPPRVAAVAERLRADWGVAA